MNIHEKIRFFSLFPFRLNLVTACVLSREAYRKPFHLFYSKNPLLVLEIKQL